MVQTLRAPRLEHTGATTPSGPRTTSVESTIASREQPAATRADFLTSTSGRNTSAVDVTRSPATEPGGAKMTSTTCRSADDAHRSMAPETTPASFAGFMLQTPRTNVPASDSGATNAASPEITVRGVGSPKSTVSTRSLSEPTRRSAAITLPTRRSSRARAPSPAATSTAGSVEAAATNVFPRNRNRPSMRCS
eukprot:Amastigsp_a1333_33.p5 type:complete len:193 gc:universal Amastigsp_a1333_33:1952-2530(+)